MWAEPCLGETRELEDPAPALKELFVLPGEPKSQLHQLPKNPLSELPVVKCKVGQSHSNLEGLVSEGPNLGRCSQSRKAVNCELSVGARRRRGLAADEGSGHVEAGDHAGGRQNCCGSKLFIKGQHGG